MDMLVSTMNDLFDSDEIAQGYQELVAYGTAVRVTKL